MRCHDSSRVNVSSKVRAIGGLLGWGRFAFAVQRHAWARPSLAHIVSLLALVSILSGCGVQPEKSSIGEQTTGLQAQVNASSVAQTSETEPSSDEVASLTNQPVAPLPVASIHVRPGEDIQDALEQAAKQEIRRVVVHEGTYAPTAARQALIWFNKRHDGIHLVAEGNVTLTAANPKIADKRAKSYPAIVNHVIYCGDGVGPDTTIDGFRITGANNYTTTKGPVIEPSTDLKLERTAYFYLDGGGVKIFGRSYPTLVNLEIVDNYSSPCGAGVSIEHRGFREQHVTVKNCVFRNNRVPLTGAALDLLGDDRGSSAVVENCLFVKNASNDSMDSRSLKLGTWKPNRGHGAITVFTLSKLVMKNCTIIGNRNGVDDTSPESTYEKCIFWFNDLEGGWPSGPRYEISIQHGDRVRYCRIGGSAVIESDQWHPSNQLDADQDPEFDERFEPRNSSYEGVGYRPVE